MNKLIFLILLSFSCSVYAMSDSWFSVERYKIKHKNAIRRTLETSCNIKLAKYMDISNRNPSSTYYKWKVINWSKRCMKEKIKNNR